MFRIREEGTLAKKQRSHYISWIYRKIKKRVPSLVFLAFLYMAVAYAGVQFALITKSLVNSALSGNYDSLKSCAALLIGLTVFRISANILAQYLTVNVQEHLERDFKRSILHTVLRTDYSAISRHHSGDLIQRLDGDAATVYQAVMMICSGLSSIVISLVSAVTALLQTAPKFTLIFGCAAILTSSTALLFRRILKQINKDNSAANGRVSGFLHEAISKLMVVQALDVAQEVEKRTDQVLDDRWTVRHRQRNIQLLSRFGMSIVSYASYLVTMIWCGFQLIQGHITPGDLTSMTALVSTVQSSATSLPMMLPRLFAVSAACDRIMELEALPSQTDPDKDAARAIYDDLTGFTADDLTFAYDRDPVMKNVSLTVPKGGLTVIVGPSGIGKSTLLKLLLGLYRPNSGSLVIDTPNGPIPVDRGTRSLFSYAPQGNFLLSGTLRENLTFTNPHATDEEIRAALYASAMDEYVATLPKGLETVLQENGAGLSEGQAQRLSLARAILSGAPVLLLDEVTSALDAATEQIVLERITALPGKTCIAVTHRPAALELASHVIEVSEAGMTITAR